MADKQPETAADDVVQMPWWRYFQLIQAEIAMERYRAALAKELGA